MRLLALALACTAADPSGEDSAPVDSAPADAGGPAGTTLFLLTLDTIRGDHVTTTSMPFLRELATEGLELPDVATHTWTYPGIGAVLSGRHPSTWNASAFDDNQDEDFPFTLGTELPLVAEALEAQGWATAYWSSNDIAATSVGLERGYGQYTAFDEGQTVEQAEGIVEWAEAHAEQSRLVHLHVNDAHSPYDLLSSSCEAEVLAMNDGGCRWDFVNSNDDSLFANLAVRSGEFSEASTDYEACRAVLAAAYACEVRAQDEALADTWAALKASGALGDTFTAVVVDHGEALLDPFTNHGFDPRLPVTAGWGLLHWPGHLDAGVLDTPATQEDILPTVEQLLAIDFGMTFTGVPVFEIPASRVRTTFYIGAPPGEPKGQVHSATDAQYQFILGVSGQCDLFDHQADPGETRNLCLEGQVPPDNLATAVAEQQSATAGWGE